MNPDRVEDRPTQWHAKFFRYLSLIGTPLAVVATFVLLVS
jgi:hypothetical protein